MHTPSAKPRDISHFLVLRFARQEDDRAIGNLLLRSFEQTYRFKLPHVQASLARKIELLDVESRRREGTVYALELGYRIIGTFCLIRPDSKASESWVPHTANLRCLAVDPDFHGYSFSELLLAEAERLASDWGCKGIALHVQRGASGVGRLYERNGFLRTPEGDQLGKGKEYEGYLKLFPLEKNMGGEMVTDDKKFFL